MRQYTSPSPPNQSAVALAYLEKGGAPQVVAKGKGLIAEQIIQKARDNGVFVHESRELVSLLMQIDLDQQIPASLYQVVAELLAWIYRLEHRHAPKERPPLNEPLHESKP